MTDATFTHELQLDTSTDPPLVLLTISHADLATPMRYVCNTVDIVSRSNTFTAYPFDFAPPSETDDGSTSARIVIDNVDQRIITTIRKLSTPPSVLVEIVLGSTPDTVRETYPPFEIRVASGDRNQLAADLADLDDDGEPVMRWITTPSLTPALFR